MLYSVYVVFTKSTDNILKKKVLKLFIYTVFTPHDFIKQDYIPVDVFCDLLEYRCYRAVAIMNRCTPFIYLCAYLCFVNSHTSLRL